MPILDGLNDVIDEFALPGGIDVERTDLVEVDGYTSSGAPAIFHLDTVTVFAANGRDLLKLVAGDRVKEVIKVFAKVKLRIALEGSTELPDVVLYSPLGDGVVGRYIVSQAEDWLAQSGHFRCLCVRIPGN